MKNIVPILTIPLLFFGVIAIASAATVPWDRPSAGTINPLYILDQVKGNYFTATSTSQASTFPYASTTAISATTASSTDLIISSINSALVLTNATGVTSGYGGSTCTNQFVRALSALGVATCNSVSLSTDITGTLGIANGGTNATSFSTSNGVVYYDGTRLVNHSGMTYSSTLSQLTVTNSQFTTSTSTNGFVTTQFGIATSSPTGTFTVEQGTENNSVWVGNQGSSTPSFMIGGVNNNGNIGIGTSSPYARVSIDNNNGTASSSIVVTEYRPSPTSTTPTLDCRSSNTTKWRLGAAATTITLTGFVPGQNCMIIVENPNQTAGAITWAVASGYILLWPNGAVPSQTTTANKQEIWSFKASQGSSTIAVLGAQTPNF